MKSVPLDNESTLVGVQIEHIDGVENLDAILAVPGIDLVVIGPYDLSASMGIVAEFTHPEYKAVIEKISTACKANSIASGIHIVSADPALSLKKIEEGFNFVAYSHGHHNFG